jgi:PAS domain S-box-containing protein
MAGKKSAATPGEVLQRRVERFLAEKDPVQGAMSLEEVRSLVHELQVHQLGLEAENEALRRMQEQLEASRRNLAEWYDFTPVGYFTFDRKSLIVDVNLTGTAALGVEKEFLLNRPFFGFVEPELRGTFHAHLQQVFSGGGKHQCRLQLVPQGGAPFLASLESLAVRNHRGNYLCRTVVSDISGRVAAEERLSEQLRFLQKMIDTVPYPIFFKDSNGLYQGCNRAFEAYYGVSPEQIMGKTVYALAPRELADLYFQKDAELFHHPGTQIYESQLRIPDGSIREIIVHKATYTNVDGAVGGLLGVILDVTDSKLAEAALRETHERLTALLETAPDPIFFKDAQGRYLMINQAGAESIGLRKEDCIGKTDAQLLPPEMAERFRRNDVELLKKSQPTLAEVFMTDVKGKKRIFQAIKFPLFDDQGQIRGIGCIARDITARRAAEEALRRGEANLQALFDTVQDFIWVLDNQGRILRVNHVIKERLGYAAEELLGRSALALHPADWHEEAAAILADLLTGKTDVCLLPLLAKDGRQIPVEAKVTRGRWFDQEALFGVSRDLTFRRTMETQLIQSAKMASLGVMAAGIAHEIRTPLTVCSSAAQFLREDDLAPEFRRQCLEKMLSGIAKASAIIENLLKFARAPENVEITRMNLGAVIDDTLALVANQARLQEVELRRERPVAPIYLDGLAGLLPQAFLNLWLNALNAMPDGGILSIRMEVTDQEAVITISDTGHGIAPSHLPHIFDPFYTTAAVGQGTGLGLSLCQSFIKQHLGAIEVESTFGQGARFTVRLPRIQQALLGR